MRGTSLARLCSLVLLLAACAPLVRAQNYATVAATNIIDPSVGGTTKMPDGLLCFQATDGSDIAIPFTPGGGGQIVTLPACATITTGVVGTLQIANPANTYPAHIVYRITITQGSAEVLRYSKVNVESQISGGIFNFDACTCSASTITPATQVYDTVQEEGAALPVHRILNFIGASVTAADDPTNNRTNVTVTAAGSPGGANTQVQFNDSSAFAGDTAFLWDKTNNRLAVGGDATLSTTKASGTAYDDDWGTAADTVLELSRTLSNLTSASAFQLNTNLFLNATYTPSGNWGSASIFGIMNEVEVKSNAFTGGSAYGMYTNVEMDGTGGNGGTAVYGAIEQRGSASTPGMNGADINVSAVGTSHIGAMNGFDTRGLVGATAIVDTYRGVYVESPVRTGTMTNVYGVRVDNMGSGANDYAISTGNGKVDIGGTFRVAPVAFASLSACAAGNEGQMAPVNNSTTNVWGATITGGGTNHVLAYCDGTNWTVAGK